MFLCSSNRPGTVKQWLFEMVTHETRGTLFMTRGKQCLMATIFLFAIKIRGTQNDILANELHMWVPLSAGLIIGVSSLNGEETVCLSHLRGRQRLDGQREDTAALIKDKPPLTRGHPSFFCTILAVMQLNRLEKRSANSFLPHANKTTKEASLSTWLSFCLPKRPKH